MFASGDEAPIPSGGVRPTFTERPVIRQSDEGKIVFECKLVGDPLPDVVWYHNDNRIKEGKRHKVNNSIVLGGCKQDGLFVALRTHSLHADNGTQLDAFATRGMMKLHVSRLVFTYNLVSIL